MPLDDVVGSFGKIVLGWWGIICWLARTWCELISTGCSIIGWLVMLVSTSLLLTNQLLFGGILFFVGFGFFMVRDLFKLVDFWLSEKKYTVSPESFVGDLVGSAISFVILFGALLAIWVFVYRVPWLLIITLELIPLTLLSTVSRAIRNFVAMTKDKLIGGKSTEPPKGPSGITKKNGK